MLNGFYFLTALFTFSFLLFNFMSDELPVFINNFWLPTLQMRRNGAARCGNDVRVHRGVVEAECRKLLFRKFGNVARICFFIGSSERKMCVSFRSAHILIKKRIRHEFRDVRETLIGKRIL